MIPCNLNANVTEWVNACIAFGNGKNVCVFVPGTSFDSFGTRHGRGGGWYDRFLSAIPREWLRIGVATLSSFKNDTKLKRQLWDEQVDYILIFNSELTSWDVCEAFPKRPCADT
jgi:hypothetical protein